MKIDKTVLDTHAVLTLKGEFDTFYCPKLQEEVDSLLADSVSRVILNLRLVKFINSTALGAIIKAHKRCRSEGGDLVVAKPSQFCREIITKLGIDRVVPLFDDEEAAERHLVAKATPESDAEVSDTSVIFSFPDEARAKLLKGRVHHGVATVSNVDDQRITFVWNPARHELNDSQLKTMFADGSAIHTKFQVKLFKKGFFDLAAKIVSSQRRQDGTVKVTAAYSSIGDADKTALSQFANDMAYLKKQITDAAE
jgi:anti-anti-sigma factor